MIADKPDVILIAYHFPPSSEIGAARPYRFYKYLKKSGRRCYVVTASAQPPDAPPDVCCVPDATAGLWQTEERKPLSLKAHAERVVRRYFLPGATGVAWSLAAARRCRAIVAEAPARRFVVVSSFPPVGALLAGLWTTFRGRLPWISDFRDPLLNPDSRRFPLADPVTTWLRTVTFRRARGVIANTEPMAAAWRGEFPWAKDKLHVIWNGFDSEDQPAARAIPARPYRLLLHAGTLYAGRTPTLILQSLERLREAEPETRDARLLLVGPVGYRAGLDRDLCDRAAQQGWLDLRVGTVPRNEAQRLAEEADFLLLLQPQSCVQVPGKLFEYLSIGRPIIALVPRRSAVEDILANAGVPYACLYPEEEAGSRDRKLLQVLRLSSRPVRFSPWFETHFNAGHQAGQLASLIDSLFAR
jgi:glycosyltransferase involved in cell wall biosynthesis